MTRSVAAVALCALLVVLPASAQDTDTWQAVLKAQIDSLRATPPSTMEVLAAPEFATAWSQAIQQQYNPGFQGQGDFIPTYDVDISAGLDALASAGDEAFSPYAPTPDDFAKVVALVQTQDQLLGQLTPEEITRQFAISQVLRAGGRKPELEFCIYILWCSQLQQ
jgi:hypothetical protein